MNRDDIIRMAREARLGTSLTHNGAAPRVWIEGADWHDELERFAALVAAAEREACAKVCDAKVDAEYATGKVDHNEIAWTMACAIAIRARGDV